MTAFDRRPALRWLVPLFAALVLITGGSVIGAISASARGNLPDRSAAQLLVDVQRARVDGLSGTIVQNASLGLPDVPGVGGNGSSDLSSLVSGSHTLRVWYAGPEHVRLALLGQLGESDVIRNGSNLWTWSSNDNSATHRTLPASARDEHKALQPSTSAMTPQRAADTALRAITPTTRVSTGGTVTVAGRPAYDLVLTPRSKDTLVGSVQIAIDGASHVPTRVQVYAKGSSSPAFEVGFTSFDPSTPSLSVFSFNPPPGTKVTQETGGLMPQQGPGQPRGLHTMHGGNPSRVLGHGWDTVVVASLPSGAAGSNAARISGLPQTILQALPRASGSWGSGHVLQGTLFSAVLTNDGRIAVGAVPTSRLFAALAGQ